MLKVLIADDEARIRDGIKNSMDWEVLGAEVVGTARNGMDAWNLYNEFKPDICLVDICMPLLSGLELIELIKKDNKDVICIIITGFDEFEYAHTAIKMNVFDYILKPVSEAKLLQLLQKAVDTINIKKQENEKFNIAKQLFEKNMPILKDKFLNELISGYLVKDEIEEQLQIYNMHFKDQVGLIVLNIDKTNYEISAIDEMNRQLKIFSIRSIFEDCINIFGYFASSIDKRENVFAFVNIEDEKAWDQINANITNKVRLQLNILVKVAKARLSFGLETAAEVYEVLVRDSERKFTSIIKGAIDYIESSYRDTNLSFTQLTDKLSVSESYMSKLFKKELGMTFSDYLTRIRIQKALELMNNPSLRIYEISEMSGYKSQHYFCTAFKRVIGKSPSEYRDFKQ